MMLFDKKVSIVQTESEYLHIPPYNPDQKYPEYLFGDVPGTVSPLRNSAYDAVRRTFINLAFDSKHLGTAQWNPLGHLIKPGETVLLKPNYVRNFHETTGEYSVSLITHGSVIRVMLDYVAIALGGKGRVIIADSPQNDAVFDEILRHTGIPEIRELYRNNSSIHIEVYDLRIEYVHKVDGVLVRHDKLPGDPLGYETVDLGKESSFEQISYKSQMFRGAEYSLSEMQKHHAPGKHEYPLCRTILQADALINLPKLKTHKKCGVTLSLKNMIGINGNKNWLPHHTEGIPAQGGDQFAEDRIKNRLEHKAVRAFKEYFPILGPLRRYVAQPIKGFGKRIFGDTNVNRIRSGNWWGNDTVWRTCIDLKRILLYADKNGIMQNEPQRRYFTLIDGIVGGEGNGPLAPDDKPCGLILAGGNPVLTDALAAYIMGFDYHHIPIISRAFDAMRWPLANCRFDDIVCVSDSTQWNGPIAAIPCDRLNFRPHFGWDQHIRVGDTVTLTPVSA
jgi:uncharacterized protein (DUF362 family)